MKIIELSRVFVESLSLIIVFLLMSQLSFSQDLDWVKTWSYNFNGTNYQLIADDIAVDDQGNSYVVSAGNTQTDFLGESCPLSQCAAILKIDPSGSLIWRKYISANSGLYQFINIDEIDIEDSSLVFAGRVNAIYDFDPAGGVGLAGNGNSSGNPIAFVAKWDLDGNFVWVETINSFMTPMVHDIEQDSQNQIVIVGSYQQTLSYNGIGSVTSQGNSDAFILKINSLTGAGLWMKSYGSSSSSTNADIARGASFDSQNNLYITGNFSGTVDFDGNGNLITANGTSDIFLQKIDPSGGVIWTLTGGGSTTDGDRGKDVVCDPQDNIILSAYASSGSDIDFTAGVNNQGSAGILLAKYDNNGQYLWANHFITNPADTDYDLVTDVSGNIYLAASFVGTIDFDPSANVYNLTSPSLWSAFIVKYNNQGSFIWGGSINNNSPNGWGGISVMGLEVLNESIYMCGTFEGTYDFDPSNGIAEHSSYHPLHNNPFIVKLSQCIPTNSFITETECFEYTAPDGQVYSSSGTYYATIPNAQGCDSLITIDLTINTATATHTQLDDITLEADQVGALYQWVDCDDNYSFLNGETNQSYTATSNGNYAVIVFDNGCSDTSACTLIDKVGLFNLDLDLKIYPNPTSGLVNVELNDNSSNKFILVNVLGKQEDIDWSKKQDFLTLDLSKLSSGMYYLMRGSSVYQIIKQ